MMTSRWLLLATLWCTFPVLAESVALPDAAAMADAQAMQMAISNARREVQQINPGEVERADAYQQSLSQPNQAATQSISTSQQYETDMEQYGPNAPPPLN